jgi:hypothetical protein
MSASAHQSGGSMGTGWSAMRCLPGVVGLLFVISVSSYLTAQGLLVRSRQQTRSINLHYFILFLLSFRSGTATGIVNGIPSSLLSRDAVADSQLSQKSWAVAASANSTYRSRGIGSPTNPANGSWWIRSPTNPANGSRGIRSPTNPTDRSWGIWSYSSSHK